jgi:membrane protease YdiL (CAAX protease family)
VFIKGSDNNGSNVVPALWVGLALLPMIASQVVRLHQHDAGSWIAWDYAGRLGALAILAAIPAARAVAFRWDKRQISLLEIALWIVGLSLVERVSQWPLRMINAAFPATVLGVYPQPTGWLYLIDLVFGLALVAASEEIIFRQCIRHALLPFLGRGTTVILATSLVFGFYHWWAGLGNILVATMLGVVFAIMLRRSVALWPVALAHYLVDLIAFF